MSQSDTLIAELEAAVKSGSSEKRLSTLRRVTDLFLHDADQLNNEQIRIFDDILCHLMKQVETRAVAELSGRLASVKKAPDEVIKRLARDDEITIAGPVLTESKRLTTADLTEIARTKGQGHLLAISSRDGLEEAVTDVLVERGDREVVVRLAGNSTVRFSETGYGTLVKRADGDETLAEKVGLRLDIPKHLLQELLSRATEAVRTKLISLAPPQLREEISRFVEKISNSVCREMSTASDFSAAEEHVRFLHQQGRLDEAAVLSFATAGKYEELAASLAALCSAPLKTITSLMLGLRNDAILLPCKAANLTWPTVEAILRHRLGGRMVSDQVIELARNDFSKLSAATAQRTLRFLQVRANVA